jgi:alpha-ketoglutarate-dependent taurine dioxygenase
LLKKYHSNEGPADIPVVFHHEMAHVPVYPNFLFFFCDQEPREGGETQFCLSNQVYEHVKREKPDFVEQLECKNLKYVRILPEEDDPGSLYGILFITVFTTSKSNINYVVSNIT